MKHRGPADALDEVAQGQELGAAVGAGDDARSGPWRQHGAGLRSHNEAGAHPAA